MDDNKTVTLSYTEWRDIKDAIEKWAGEQYRDEDYDRFMRLWDSIDYQTS
jgi:hypothetical protein